jgi:hypothetical protein
MGLLLKCLENPKGNLIFSMSITEAKKAHDSGIE